VRLLLDTQIVIWAATDDPRLRVAGRTLIGDASNQIVVSVVSLWEVAIKFALGKADFRHSAADLRSGMRRAGWEELNLTGEHALAVSDLPDIHGDPFDRVLLAQAHCEGLSLVTADRMLWKYGNPVQRV
jgi:PIN domain nuclease of toxin-antitoxin system